MTISLSTASFLHSVSGYALVLGVLLTAVGTVGQLWMGGIKETYQEAEVSEAKTVAKESGERARSAEGEVQLLRAPRALNPEVREHTVQQLSRFKGQEYAAVLASSGFDVRPLWVAIDELLREAGWSRGNPAGLASGDPPAGIAIEAQPGLYVVIDPEHYGLVGEPAKALVDALNESGVEAHLGGGRDHKEKRDNIITVRVGPKPQQ